MEADRWNQRYQTPDYIFGEEPNDFLAQNAGALPAGGAVLCLADGEGRNGVFLAGRGHAVTAIDQSAVGLEKAKSLARRRGVPLATKVADLSDYLIQPAGWDGIVSIFVHLPSDLRRRVLRQVVDALKPGGVFLLESYRPQQLELGTGGPSDLDRFPTLPLLKEELAGLRLTVAQEIEREIHEGSAHNGRSAVVQVLAVKPV